MANGTQEDTSFLDKYRVQAPPPAAEDTSFLEKYRAPEARPGLATEATGIGPRRMATYNSGASGPIESRIEDFLNPTTMYKKEHPILGGIGEGLRNLRETFTPGVMAAALLLGGPGGLEGESGPIAPKRASVPAMSLPGGRLPRVAYEPTKPAAGMPRTVFDEPRQLGPVPQSERGPAPSMRTPSPETMRVEEKPPIQIEPMQKKPLSERRLGQAGRKPTVEQVVNQATGVKPLERNVPLREQFKTPSVQETDPIKMKYPDPEIRQMVRVNGERMYEAAKGDPATLKAIHDMTRVDLRQALINSGEDMGQMTVSGSKFAGSGSINRQEAFNRLLDKGLKPSDIVRMGKAPQQKQ